MSHASAPPLATAQPIKRPARPAPSALGPIGLVLLQLASAMFLLGLLGATLLLSLGPVPEPPGAREREAALDAAMPLLRW